MKYDLYRLKIDVQKIEELYPILDKLDTIIEMLAYYDTDEARMILGLLSGYRKEIEVLIENKDDLMLLGDDLRKGSFHGARKLDIDLALNKQGIKEAKTLEEAIAIWINENTRVYYSGMIVNFTDGSNVGINFTNDDNTPISISTNEELAWQINRSTAITDKMINTRCVVDSGGRVGNLVRITDLGSQVSNVRSVTLLVEQKCQHGHHIALKPVYTWLDTTSILILLMSVLHLIDRLPEVNELNDNMSEIINNLWAIQIISHYIKGFAPRSWDMGKITQPLGNMQGHEKDIFEKIAGAINEIIAVANLDISEIVVDVNKVGGTFTQGTTIGEEVAKEIMEEYAIQLQLRRGTTAENALFVGAMSELVHLTDTNELAIHDGVTAGGAIIGNNKDTILNLTNTVNNLSDIVNNMNINSGAITDNRVIGWVGEMILTPNYNPASDDKGFAIETPRPDIHSAFRYHGFDVNKPPELIRYWHTPWERVETLTNLWISTPKIIFKIDNTNQIKVELGYSELDIIPSLSYTWLILRRTMRAERNLNGVLEVKNVYLVKLVEVDSIYS